MKTSLRSSSPTNIYISIYIYELRTKCIFEKCVIWIKWHHKINTTDDLLKLNRSTVQFYLIYLLFKAIICCCFQFWKRNSRLIIVLNVVHLFMRFTSSDMICWVQRVKRCAALLICLTRKQQCLLLSKQNCNPHSKQGLLIKCRDSILRQFYDIVWAIQCWSLDTKPQSSSVWTRGIVQLVFHSQSRNITHLS